MQTTIYYFSGTGNSYRIANRISDELENVRLINMAQDQSTEIHPSSAVIGFVFPLHYFGLPVIVEDFLRNLHIPVECHVFILVTRGEPLAGGVKRQLDQLFYEKKRDYHFLRYITMGNNYPFYGFNSSTETTKRVRNQKSDEKLAAIILDIQGRKRSKRFSILDYPPFPQVTLNIPIYGYRHFLDVHHCDSNFVVDHKRCNKCKKCQTACPVGNIGVNTHPTWKHERCQMCLACYHVCPQRAIQYIDPLHKVSTTGKRQYWNFPNNDKRGD